MDGSSGALSRANRASTIEEKIAIIEAENHVLAVKLAELNNELETRFEELIKLYEAQGETEMADSLMRQRDSYRAKFENMQ